MKIQIINPNTSQDMTHSIDASAQSIASISTNIVTVCPKHGVESIEGHYDEAISAVGVLELVQQGCLDGVDGHIIACFGDPALHAAREISDAPVLGIAEAAFHVASLISTKFTIVTTLSRTKIIAEHLLHEYGFSHKCSKIRCIDLPVLALEQDEKNTYQRLKESCLAAKENDDIGAIVLGCGGMSKMVDQLSRDVGIPIIDGVGAAVKLVEAIVELGIKTSKWGGYAYPRVKR